MPATHNQPHGASKPTPGKKRLAALFTIDDIDDNLRELLSDKDGYHLHKAMIDYWLELRYQRTTEQTTGGIDNGS